MPVKKPKKAARIRTQISQWQTHWKDNIEHYYRMMDFVLGDQWEEKETTTLKNWKKIPLMFNKLAPLANHVLGEQRQNTPNLEIEADENTTAEDADVVSALIKKVSLDSNAKVVYQTAFEQALIGGFGAFYADTEYSNNKTFDLDPKIRSLKDPCKAFFDIGAINPCKTDGMFSGYETVMTRKKFRSVYGKDLERKIGNMDYETDDSNKEPRQSVNRSQAQSIKDGEAGDGDSRAYSDDYFITIIDYYERLYKTKKIYQLSDVVGTILDGDELGRLESVEIDGKKAYNYRDEIVTVEKTRDAPIYTIVHSQWAGDYELEKSDFPSEQLPLVFLDQHSRWDRKGKQITRSFFKDARDPQRYLNYLKTQCAYILKISRFDQFMASRENIQTQKTQQIWADPMNEKGVLLYDIAKDGSKPERLTPPELSQSLTMQAESAMLDIQTSTGLYDTQLGNQGDVVSGVASDNQSMRGSKNTFVAFDNLNRAIACMGEIINEMRPKIFDTQRNVRLNMPDTGEKTVTLNQPVDNYGAMVKNDMSQGTYKIRLVPGPSFEGQKSQNLQSMEMVLQNAPGIFGVIGDLVIENLPMANNTELRNRIRATIDPAIIEAGKTGQPIPKSNTPSPDEQMAALKQQELTLKAQTAEAKYQDDVRKNDLEKQKLQLTALQTHQDMTFKLEALEKDKQEMEAKYQEQRERYQAEIHRINTDAEIAHAKNVATILTSVHKNTQPKGQENNEHKR